MGRREAPIAQCDKALKVLVRWLRDHRTRARLSYAQLADRTRHPARPANARCSAATLARAASGHVMPKRRVVLAYATACGADPAEAERLWKRARYHESLNQGAEEPTPHIRYVRNSAELRAALVDLYRKDGCRPYQELEDISGGVLTHATVGRLISTKTRRPTGRPTRQFVVAFARACGVRDGVALDEWGQAWDRVEELRLGSHPMRRQPALQTRLRPDGIIEVLYADRDRLPDGQEVWHWNTANEVMARANQLAQTLTARELEAARNIRRLMPPTKKRMGKRSRTTAPPDRQRRAGNAAPAGNRRAAASSTGSSSGG
ncbi:helix-turn-helix domain-containing protein [Streptomyces platensis]|uniref:helix-turn-helix domain-containing protein n=1 Tax=Streptomyces platensis TaxID=58346 RepID=UPI0013023CB0|nr:helix-turn-helix transcriptional regulator [Streptomyces platensis]